MLFCEWGIMEDLIIIITLGLGKAIAINTYKHTNKHPGQSSTSTNNGKRRLAQVQPLFGQAHFDLIVFILLSCSSP